MDNKMALEKMKQLLVDISSKNESLNNDNNDLNIKIISLIKLLKSKDAQINLLQKNLLKKNLKNIFYKKNLIQKQKLQKAFNIFKNNTKPNIINKKEKLIYSNENNIFIQGIKNNKYKDIGIGDYKINQKYYIRKVACFNLLKKLKNLNNNEENKENEINAYLKFKNIEQQNEVSNIYIKSVGNNNKDKSKYVYSDFSFEIKNNNNIKIFDNKKLKNENIYENFTILGDNNNSMKLLEKKYEEIVKEKNIMENEFINIKKDSLETKNYLNEYITKYNNLNNIINNKKNEIKIDNKNKFYLNINSCKININYEIDKINNIFIVSNDKIISVKEKYIYYNNERFNILAKKNKKVILKKYNFNLNIFNNKDNNIPRNDVNHNNLNLIISKENNINLIKEKKPEKEEKNENQYDLIEPLKYNIAEYKKNNNKLFDIIELSNSFSFNYISQKIKKEKLLEITEISNFYIKNTEKKEEIDNNIKKGLINDSSLKIIILDLKLNILNIKLKNKFFIKLIFFYFQKKITESFKMFRNLLINLKLKILLKNKLNGPSQFYFLKYYLSKYHSNILHISLLSNIETNTKLTSQITIFQETFKKYEESNLCEKAEKDSTISKQKNIINDLNKENKKLKENFDKLKLEAKNNTSELITISNDLNKNKKIIEKLNKEIKEIQDEKINLQNQINNQQEVIKNLNEKIKKDQFEYEQNEIDVNTQIEKLKVQFDEYEKSIKNLNNQNMTLKNENEKLKINNENLNNNKEELISIIQESKNYEIENESLISLNKELKNNNDELNIKYKNLKKEFDNLKNMSEESKNELTKAMNEMELYSELLQTLEMKVKDAENKKINAENERDKAINDVREIRQRYINIMGEKYA